MKDFHFQLKFLLRVNQLPRLSLKVLIMRNQLLLFFLISFSMTCSLPQAKAQNHPFGSHQETYASGILFPNQYTQAQIDEFVSDYYDQWKSDWLRTDPGGNGYRVVMDAAGRTTSESQGYGMIIVPNMAGHDAEAQTIFDGLYTYSRAHPSEGNPKLMDWAQPDATGNSSAFDGDADIAYGLLLADKQWGSNGRINYAEEAKSIIEAIYSSTIGSDSNLPMLGDWVNPNGSGSYNQWSTRSSDFMNGHFRAFGQASGNEVQWNAVIDSTQKAVGDINSEYGTGLMPDFVVVDPVSGKASPAPPNFLESEHDEEYWYNAGRTPWRFGADAVLNGDAVSRDHAQLLSEFFQAASNGDPNQILGGYELDGDPLNNWSDLFFIAPVGVAAMTGTDADDQAWLNSIFDNIKGAHVNYYSDSVNLNSLLVMSGNALNPVSITAVPEPTNLSVLGLGLVLGALRRRRSS